MNCPLLAGTLTGAGIGPAPWYTTKGERDGHGHGNGLFGTVS